MIRSGQSSERSRRRGELPPAYTRWLLAAILTRRVTVEKIDIETRPEGVGRRSRPAPLIIIGVPSVEGSWCAQGKTANGQEAVAQLSARVLRTRRTHHLRGLHFLLGAHAWRWRQSRLVCQGMEGR
jgi:hypothetical protein